MTDHFLFAFFAIGFPLVTGPLYLKRKPAMLAGDREVRRREYVETIVWLAGMGAVTVGAWLVRGRPLADLGIVFTGGWRPISAIVAASGAVALLYLQVRAVRGDAATRKAAREALAPVREFFPTSTEEERLFRGVSFAAGIGEEIYYRGFLIWYVSLVVSPLWAIVLSSLLFGLAHWMHGVQATLRSTVTGGILAALYIFSGSLWASMLLHTAIDLTSGESGMAAFEDEG